MAIKNLKYICLQLWPHREHKHQRSNHQSNLPTNSSTQLVSSILYLSCLLQFTAAHVALTYPPARKYDLDFLDNSHTSGPCGMPRGSIRTSLLSGSKLNVTWHLAYPHKGGFRLQILDSVDRPLVDLTPHLNGSEFVRTDTTAQSYQVTLPNNFDCHNCTIRLLRQADEWSSNYRFWSCADVDIKQHKEFKETCSGNGKYFPSRCRCERNFYGPMCQYRDECSNNHDCGIQGKCIDLQGTALPRRQCYCNYGWYAVGCTKRSPYKNTDLDLSMYAMKQLSQDYNVYWRLLEEQKEIEVVLKVNGTTWVGFGWRPRSMTKECKNFPLINIIGNLTQNLQGSSSEHGPSPEPEPKSEPPSQPTDKSVHEPYSKPDPKTVSGPRLVTKPTSVLEPKSEPESSSKYKIVVGIENPLEGVTSAATGVSYRISALSGRRSRGIPDATHAQLEPHSNPEPIAEPYIYPKSEPDSKYETALRPEEPTSVSKPEPESEPSVEPGDKSEPQPSSEADPKPEVEGPQNKKTDSKKYELNTYTPIHDFNPMDCTDIVIGSARGMASRVGDFYTRDRSTPRHDEFYGGKNHLTLATGFEKDGVTTVIFRKKLIATEPTDHTLADELTHVIWAKGQETGNYIHIPSSGIETEMSSVKKFYQPDELKYHGHKMQRGVTQINFYENNKRSEIDDDSNVLDNDCYGHWKYPSNCSPQNHTCQYYASWETIERGDDMRWHIETTNTQTWTGIGFSSDEKMSQTDSIIGWVDRNGRSFLMDTWINGYSSPKLDDRQDIFDTSGRIEKGVTILEFTRKRISNDEQDLSFTDDYCMYLLFPVFGGAFNAVNKKIRKHETVPQISQSRVCIKSCKKELEKILYVVATPVPNRLIFAVGIKLINLAESFEAPSPGTVDFKNLAATISDSFNGALKSVPGYYKTDIISFAKESATSMIANLQAIFDKDEYGKSRTFASNTIWADVTDSAVKNKDTIKTLLLDKISAGKVGALTVDPQFFDFQALEYKSSYNSEDTKLSFLELSEVRLYTVLGLIAALVFIALIQASCTIYKTSKNVISNKENLVKNSSWRDYSTSTNFAFDPYGETEEKVIAPPTVTSHKDKLQNPVQMSHSATSNSQMYYDNSANGYTDNQATHSNGNSSINMQEYRSNGRSQQHYRNGKPAAEGYNDINHHDRAERNECSDLKQYCKQSSQNLYAERAYSLPRQQQGLMQPSSYYTQDRSDRSAQRRSVSDEFRQYRDKSREDLRLVSNGGTDTPDFYFMPSQRKYSGEVVRVYVDYKKDPN